jgi:3-isopropylmalate/(R)-2-methylmalate dehydratase small subunit
MSSNLIFEGNCWKFGHNIPSDMLVGGNVMFRSIKEMAKTVLVNADPAFASNVQPGDILVAGRNFCCSSGRALAAKALQATGIGAVVCEQSSRTFYRNAHEIGLALLEAPGVHAMAETGHRLRVDIVRGTVENLTTGASIQGTPPPEFLLEMLAAGGLIPLLKAGSKYLPLAGGGSR